MGEVTAKVWGTTELLISLPQIQVHRIKFEAGAVCSKHYHQTRYNAFYVLEGVLSVHREHENVRQYRGVKEPIIMFPGCYEVVPPGVLHWFEGETEGTALEIYFPDGVSEHDIVRLSEGFKR